MPREFPCKITSVNYSENSEDINGWECKCFEFTTPSGVNTYLASLRGPDVDWKGPYPGIEGKDFLPRKTDGTLFRVTWKSEIN
ncbi:hypothetical protein CBR59_29875 [Bacillus thuringiensis]|uniref:hypothetical protein n=1 Tax=Bacillus cereus group TaxID=86661 RepID=UPI000B4A5DA5|nr:MULTISPECIES: hypothetical protein [Bacillus cereus group]PNK22792.1 hypothetical protein CBP87_30220 [Bacillus thuringiensis]PNK46437.1 hypothetical protein CBR59_29875 [Bacillus thuringiensis]